MIFLLMALLVLGAPFIVAAVLAGTGFAVAERGRVDYYSTPRRFLAAVVVTVAVASIVGVAINRWADPWDGCNNIRGSAHCPGGE